MYVATETGIPLPKTFTRQDCSDPFSVYNRWFLPLLYRFFGFLDRLVPDVPETPNAVGLRPFPARSIRADCHARGTREPRGSS